MNNKTLPTLVALVVVYFFLKYFIPYGNYVIYPVNLLVTFMHEFGHAFFAVITGGSVDGIQVNSDGSGLTTSSGGIRMLILMGGYIGSAIFGNILLYIGFKNNSHNKLAETTLYIFSGIVFLTAIFWFSSYISSIILFIIAGLLVLLAKKTNFDKLIIQFLGVASLLFIIEDFNVGPSSDLSKFSEIFIIIPQFAWMVIWLILVLFITALNIKYIYFSKKK